MSISGIMSGLSTLLASVVKLVALFGAYALGKNSEKKRQSQAAVETKDKQLNTIAAAPKTEDGKIAEIEKEGL